MHVKPILVRCDHASVNVDSLIIRSNVKRCCRSVQFVNQQQPASNLQDTYHHGDVLDRSQVPGDHSEPPTDETSQIKRERNTVVMRR